MFYYYGRKKQIAHLYPSPSHDIIIEPFAGSAAYSLHGNNWKKEVILRDTSKWCIDIWNYLQACSPADILSLPMFDPGESLDMHTMLSKAEQCLIGLHLNPGSSSPKRTATKASRWAAGQSYISKNMHKIKHWDIKLADYKSLSDKRACWFIDPPYYKAGKHYQQYSIDYEYLSIWIRSRRGQVIACEGEGASYLPFNYLGSVNNGGLNKSKKKSELIFIQSN